MLSTAYVRYALHVHTALQNVATLHSLSNFTFDKAYARNDHITTQKLAQCQNNSTVPSLPKLLQSCHSPSAPAIRPTSLASKMSGSGDSTALKCYRSSLIPPRRVPGSRNPSLWACETGRKIQFISLSPTTIKMARL
jgi:hypothetical protein